MKYFKGAINHFKLVMKHKVLVFILCCKAGIPIQGLVHDLSKFSKDEFIESVKYYVGTYSPITECKKINGYSKAWLHHKGRNKHHFEYWYDWTAPNQTPVIPYKYMVEMVCDTLSAGIVYNGKNWTRSSQLNYWNSKKAGVKINKKCAKFLDIVYKQVSIYGINKVVNKRNLMKVYKKCCK